RLSLLSVGYSTCHWCHVMEEESFKNKEIGDIMNKNFVCIKVDREERPDVDKVYMTFVQATSGGGGWPMSVWLTPDLKPFAGGTYFPPEDGLHRVGFRTVLLRIAEQWKENKDALLENSQKILEALLRRSEIRVRGQESPPPAKEVMATCFQQLSSSYDEEYGGFSESPKFPTPVNVNFLFTYWALHRTTPEGARALQMALHTLRMMAHGGIHDHIAQGFHRYSTDQHWHVPHFEKMLYDQGQLAAAYSRAFQISGDRFFADVARDVLLYVSRDLSDQVGCSLSWPEGSCFPCPGMWLGAAFPPLPSQLSSRAAKLFPWLPGLGMGMGVQDPGGVSPSPLLPWRGDHSSAPRCPAGPQAPVPAVNAWGGAGAGLSWSYTASRKQQGSLKPSSARKQRLSSRWPCGAVPLSVVTASDRLMISGFAQAGVALAEQGYVSRAARAAAFLRRHLFQPTSGRLLRSCYRGEDDAVEQSTVPIQGFLEDYVFVIQALFDLYEASLEQGWLEWALQLQHTQDKLFWDPEGAAYFSSEAGDSSLLLRLKDDQDGAEPTPNSVAVTNLLRAASYSGHMEWVEKAGQILAAFSERLQKIPITLPEMAPATA
ncbi:Spermatogenesis-associated protein 20, partial [Opisthocomus hoazin]